MERGREGESPFSRVTHTVAIVAVGMLLHHHRSLYAEEKTSECVEIDIQRERERERERERVIPHISSSDIVGTPLGSRSNSQYVLPVDLTERGERRGGGEKGLKQKRQTVVHTLHSPISQEYSVHGYSSRGRQRISRRRFPCHTGCSRRQTGRAASRGRPC